MGATIDETLKIKTLGLPGNYWAPLVIEYCNVADQLTPTDLIMQWEKNLAKLIGTVKAMPGAIDLIEFFVENKVPIGVATSASYDSFSKKR